MLADLGEVARPHLKSWYAAVVLDPRFSGLEGLTSLADVQAADLDAIVPPRESNEAMDEAAFVRTPDGSLDFGAITPEIASAIKRQAGPIRLRHGNDAWGLVHIRQRHDAQIRASGFDSAEQFVNAVAGNFTAIYPRPGRSLDVVLDDGARGKLIVQLEPSQGDGDFYDVKTATPIRADQYKNAVPLWERTGPSTPSAETDSLDPWDHSDTRNSVTGRGRNVQSAAVPTQQQPAEMGPFGPILRGYEGRWREAARELERRQTGDAIGALHHKDVGPIDLPWGQAGTNRHNGAGLAKLIAWHPEVLADLQGFIDRLHVDGQLSTPRRIQLRDETGQAGIRLDYDGVAKTWLLTAFEAGNRRSAPSGLTLAKIWESELAGRDASPGTAPAKPSDAGWGRRTGKDNVDDPRQNVQSASGGRRTTDPAVTTDNRLKPLTPPERRADEALFDWAKRVVGEAGRKTGHEHLVALDGDGVLIEFGTASLDAGTGLNDKLFAAMMNASRRIVIIHNHPRNTPVSRDDIAALAYPGMHSVWAIGKDGRDTRAALTPAARRSLIDSAKNADDHLTAHARLQQSATDALRAASDFLMLRVEKGKITEAAGIEAAVEAVPLIAQRAGVVDYFSTSSYDPTAVPGLGAVFDKAADQMRKDIFDDGSSILHDDGPDRSANAARHPGDMEGLEAGSGKDAPIPGAFPLSEGSKPDDPGQNRLGAGLETEERAVKATPESILKALRNRIRDAKPTFLAAVPLNYFPELANGRMPAIDDYLRVKRMMDAYRGDRHEEAATLINRWRGVIASNAYVTIDKGRAQQISGLMHFATLNGVDPSITTAEEQAKPEWKAAREMYIALPPKARAIFEDVRDVYKRQAEELDQILLDNIRKGQQIALENAEKAYKATLQDIKRQRLDPIARRKAEEDAASAFKAASTQDRWRMNARLTKLRRELEQSRVQPPYFPLARFGRYFVSVKETVTEDGKEEVNVLHFSRHETEADRQEALERLNKEFSGKNISTGVLEEKGKAREAMDPRMVAHLDKMLADAQVDDSIRDALYQRYLATLPDLSMRKRQIHRKGTEGFETDAFRVFASTMFHAGHQMARLKFSLDLQENLNRAREQAQAVADSTRTMTLYNELAKRHQWVMNPTGAGWVNWATSAAFVWYLGMSPAAALVNLAQTWMLGVPLLGAKYGISAATAELAKTTSQYLTGGSLNPTTLKGVFNLVAMNGAFNMDALTQDERSAMDAFQRSGLIDRTMSHDLAAVGETGTTYNPVRHQVMKVIGGWFHNVEVLNRSVTALAAYRLARKAGSDHLSAINAAIGRTYDIHFDVSNSSRPRMMQRDEAKVLLVFRSFNINMLYRLFRDAHQAFKGESEAVRREARIQLAGTTGMMMLMAGIRGTWGFGAIMATVGFYEAIKSFFGGDDDDEADVETRFRAAVLEALGPELGGVLMDGIPGHYSRVELASRIGMPDLWFRSSSRDVQGKEAFEYWLGEFAGAVPGMFEQAVTGFTLITEGNVARGVEAMAPKFIRDPLKAYRTFNEGVTSLRGDEILSKDDLSAYDILVQGAGFTPAKVSETYDRNNALRNMETRITEKRSKLINRFAKAVESRDAEGRKKAYEDIRQFNRAPLHRGVRITSDTLERSLKTRARNRAKREDGVLIQNDQLGRDLRAKLPERVYR